MQENPSGGNWIEIIKVVIPLLISLVAKYFFDPLEKQIQDMLNKINETLTSITPVNSHERLILDYIEDSRIEIQKWLHKIEKIVYCYMVIVVLWGICLLSKFNPKIADISIVVNNKPYTLQAITLNQIFFFAILILIIYIGFQYHVLRGRANEYLPKFSGILADIPKTFEIWMDKIKIESWFNKLGIKEDNISLRKIYDDVMEGNRPKKELFDKLP